MLSCFSRDAEEKNVVSDYSHASGSVRRMAKLLTHRRTVDRVVLEDESVMFSPMIDNPIKCRNAKKKTLLIKDKPTSLPSL